jgi:hypothetical protein
MSDSIFDWEPKPKEWYDSLHPLVKRDEDREAVIARIVEDWTTDLGDLDPDSHIAKFKEKFDRSPVVENFAFVHEDDAGQRTPIDLGEILRAVEAKIEASGAPDKFFPTRHILIRGCCIDAVNVENVPIRPHWSCVGCAFGDRANFGGSTFGDVASFQGSMFGDDAWFASSTFGLCASFSRSIFGKRAMFDNSTFGYMSMFHRSTFGDEASFHGSMFGGQMSFDGSTFGDEASFRGSMFGDQAWFQKSTFGDGAKFAFSTFGDRAWFADATFGDHATFQGARFGDRAGFPAARFRGRLDTFLLTWGNKPTAIRRVLDWNLVRSLGALPVLARISYLSLLVVPLLAGSWNAVAAYFDLTTPMSPAWAVAFFAALFITLGHLVYTITAPQVVREKSRDDLVAQRLGQWANATDREQRDLLQRACDAIQAVARLRPWDRNPNLVRRHGEVVWIPGSLDELDKVKDWEEERREEIDADVIERRPENKEIEEQIRRPLEAVRPRFSHEELLQIVIDEGAKAEFDAAARESLGSCAISAFLYLVATLLVFWLTVSQTFAVLAAALKPNGHLGRGIHHWIFWAFTGVTAAVLFAGAFRSAWRGKSARLVRTLILLPLLAAAITIALLRIAAQSHVPALDHASLWVGVLAAAVVAVLGLVGCGGWVREQLKPPNSPPTG